MAKTPHSIIALILLFNILTSVAMAARDVPKTNLKKPDDVKHPDMYFNHDRGYLIPGLGRGIKPKSKKGFNPFTYNPITGSNNGIPGLTVPSFGGGVGRSYLPGGDDTLIPNPGFEVPSPGRTGSTLDSVHP